MYSRETAAFWNKLKKRSHSLLADTAGSCRKHLQKQEKGAKLSELRAPYQKMSDEELLRLVRDFVMENGREPMQKDVLYDRELKARFGPWTRMLEKAGTRPVSQRHLDKLERRREKRIRQRKLRKERREAEITQL